MEHEKHPENCKQMFALLSQYLDQELAPQSCEEIEQHLQGCPPCIEFVESLRRSMKVCKECEPGASEPPPPLDDTTRDRLRAAYQAALQRRGA